MNITFYICTYIENCQSVNDTYYNFTRYPASGHINDSNVLKLSVTTTNTLEYLITALICDDMH